MLTSTGRSNNNVNSIIATSTLLISTSGLFVSTLLYMKHKYELKIKEVQTKLSKERLAERTGRTRAEMKVRSLEKEILKIETNGSTVAKSKNGSNKEKNNNKMIMKCIGEVISPFTKRMGTPRQGTLAPHSRAYIKLYEHEALVDGLLDYSHIWILFQFHANTDLSVSKKTKIKPPRAGGVKVGMLASRSPHRPNPIGLSLVSLVGIERDHKELGLVVVIEGLDLVNSTPVYDIKPCVPWDMPTTPLKSPPWVTQEDALPSVQFTTDCLQTLKQFHKESYFAPFYPPTSANNNSYESLIKTIEEVLKQDPRASHVRGSNTNETKNNDDDNYTILFCHVQIAFKIQDSIVHVVKAQILDDDNYMLVDNIPILNQNDQ